MWEWTEEKTLLVSPQLLMAAGPPPVGRQQEQPRPLLPWEMSPNTAPHDSQQGEVTLHNTPFLQVKTRHKSHGHWACQASAFLHHHESQGRCQTWGAVGPWVLRAPKFLEIAGIIAPSGQIHKPVSILTKPHAVARALLPSQAAKRNGNKNCFQYLTTY